MTGTLGRIVGDPADSSRGRGAATRGAAPALLAVLLTLLSVLAVCSVATAPAAHAGQIVDRAASALRSGDRVYVDPGAQNLLTGSDLSDVRDRVQGASTPTYLAVLPASVRNEYSSPAAMLRDLYQRTRRSGSYIVLTPTQVYVGSSVVAGQANAIQNQANTAGNGREAVLSAVSGLESAASGGSTSGGTSRAVEPARSGSGAGAGLAVLALLLVVGGGAGLFLFRSRRRKQRREQEAFAEVRTAAEEDVTRLGEDIAGLDLDLSRAAPDTRTDYQHALDSYDRAKAALESSRRPEDLGAVTQALEDGRYAMECVRARLAGRALPERRPPCFFNPQHGPSVEDVQWAPPGGGDHEGPRLSVDA